MALEIFEAICEYYNDDKDTKYECLSHLYNTTKDGQLKGYIEDYFYSISLCPKCLSKILYDECEYCENKKTIKGR